MVKLDKKSLTIDDEHIICEFFLNQANAVILHGAGNAERTRYYAVAAELQKHGLGTVLFDFSGHGESSGQLSESSLARRAAQASAVIDQIVPEGQLYLAGFSMGAQTLCDLLPEFGERTTAVLLACPAIYRSDVHNLAFGTTDFTAKLREENSWRTSDAPKRLENYRGRIVIATGSDDQVIPDGVINLLKQAASNCKYLEYPEAPHALAAWLKNHPQELARLIDALVS